MGCDWIEGDRAVFGYCLQYHQVFPRGTELGDAECVYGSECYYGDEPNPHETLAKAWSEASELPDITAMLGVVTRPGSYEATGYSDHSRVVFGVSLSEVFSPESCADGSWRDRLSRVDLPASLRERVLEFVPKFRRELGEPATTTLDLAPPSLVIFV